MTKQERLRADIWASLRPVIEGEMSRTGLTAQEVINMALCDYFGISPRGTAIKPAQQMQTATTTSTTEEDDYI